MPMQLYEANHLYLMKKALIKGIRKRSNTTSIYNPSIMKMTYQIKTAKLVPVFAARWRSICKFFSGQTIGKTKQEKATVVRKRHTHLHSKRKPKEDLKQSSQSRYNSHFNLNKQAYTQHEAALQKEQSDAPCNFMKLIISI